MYHFTDQEKQLVKKLFTHQWLRDLVPFRDYAQVIFEVYTDEERIPRIIFRALKFESESDDKQKEERDKILSQVVDTFSLLDDLMKKGLVRVYPRAYTNIDVFSAIRQISLGDPQDDAKSFIVILDDNSKYLADFIKNYENYLFKASNALIEFASDNFKTPEEIRHTESMEQVKKANKFTLWLAITTISLTLMSLSVQMCSSFEGMEIDKEMLNQTVKGNVKDSVIFYHFQNELNQTNEILTTSNQKLDSLIQEFSLFKNQIKRNSKIK
jgi:hypothetical protein